MNKTILAIAFTALALPAAAQTATPRLDKRQEVQDARIEQGARSGALTAREQARLEAGQGRVEAREGRAKADGQVTARERARLAKAQNRQGRKIARQKHDAQKKRPAT